MKGRCICHISTAAIISNWKQNLEIFELVIFSQSFWLLAPNNSFGTPQKQLFCTELIIITSVSVEMVEWMKNVFVNHFQRSVWMLVEMCESMQNRNAISCFEKHDNFFCAKAPAKLLPHSRNKLATRLRRNLYMKYSYTLIINVNLYKTCHQLCLKFGHATEPITNRDKHSFADTYRYVERKLVSNVVIVETVVCSDTFTKLLQFVKACFSLPRIPSPSQASVRSPNPIPTQDMITRIHTWCDRCK